jgi:hypothetical protein
MKLYQQRRCWSSSTEATEAYFCNIRSGNTNDGPTLQAETNLTDYREVTYQCTVFSLLLRFYITSRIPEQISVQFYSYSPGNVKVKSTQTKSLKMHILLSERQTGVYSDLLVEENKSENKDWISLGYDGVLTGKKSNTFGRACFLQLWGLRSLTRIRHTHTLKTELQNSTKPTNRHGVIIPKTWIFNNSLMKTSNIAKIEGVWEQSDERNTKTYYTRGNSVSENA